jgi:hypothetical protein
MSDHLHGVHIRTRRNPGRLFSFALLPCFLVLCLTQSIAQIANPQEKPMKHYALIFHPTRPLTPEEQQQRTVDIAAWVKKVTDMGITLDPRNFGETVANFALEESKVVSRNGSSDPKLVTIVFFDSPDRDQAVNIARIHPGLHYGVTVEVREWVSPRELTARETR